MRNIRLSFLLIINFIFAFQHAAQTMTNSLIARKLFFQNIMGMRECDFKKLSKENQIKLYKEKISQSSGTLEILSLKDLRSRTEALLKILPNSHVYGKFNVVEGKNTKNNSWFRPQIDIGAMQANQANQNANFQVASNFNVLEASGSPRDGIEQYLFTTAQGEEASISAAPGAIYRMYFLDHKKNGTQYIGQFEKQVELLDAFDGITAFKIPIYNGYIHFDKHNPCRKLTDHEIEEYIPLVKIALHRNIQVTTGLAMLPGILPQSYHNASLMEQSLYGYNQVIPTTQNQFINQIFTAAVNLADPSNVNQPGIENLAKMLLYAAYEGTLKTSFLAHKNFGATNKVFLTIVGGGVFCNKLNWVATAIERCEEFIKQSGLNVTLIIYNGNDPNFSNRMKTLVNKFDGTYSILK